ncbi:morphogenetic protein [Klebsiella pneumoniae]|uniref:morphogenetic protein n=1 Tax=Klebsiella pneumoniae TaxID=573 RepID=UPI003F8D3EF9
MTERGMIFNAEMVRAILDGRKTQTRRIMKIQPEHSGLGLRRVIDSKNGSDDGKYFWSLSDACGLKIRSKSFTCPFGSVGDRIWVRETFQGPLFDYDLMDSYCKDPTPFEKPEFCVYKADGVPAPEFYDADDELHCCWRPSIHMPRWASRILLEITNVRVERLNAISEEDAAAEGVPPAGSLLPDYPGTFLTPKGDFATAKVAFQRLWESIYGAENWQANPWVWVIEFKRVEGGAA